MKKVMKSILEPNTIIGFIVFNLSFGLLIYVFSNHLDDTPIAYISYVLSTYALVIFCIWFYKICKFSNDFIKESKIYKLYHKNIFIATRMTLYCSLTLNLIYGSFKFIMGIYYKSWFFITFTVYYLLLCFMKFLLVSSFKNDEFGSDLMLEYKKLKATGIFLLSLDIILMGIIILILHQDLNVSYPGYLIYIVAIYDFYLIISALINVFKYKNQKSPIISASKCINLSVAMISMISLEVAMMSEFGNGDGNFRFTMISISGFAVAIMNSFMAIYMIVKAKKQLKNLGY